MVATRLSSWKVWLCTFKKDYSVSKKQIITNIVNDNMYVSNFYWCLSFELNLFFYIPFFLSLWLCSLLSFSLFSLYLFLSLSFFSLFLSLSPYINWRLTEKRGLFVYSEEWNKRLLTVNMLITYLQVCCHLIWNACVCITCVYLVT